MRKPVHTFVHLCSFVHGQRVRVCLISCVCVCDSVFVLVTLWGVVGDSFFLLSASEG